MSDQVDHSRCNFAYQQVKCDRCKHEFQCTPWDDFYCAAEGDHCCETCLVGGRRIASVDLDVPLDEPVFHKPAGGSDG